MRPVAVSRPRLGLVKLEEQVEERERGVNKDEKSRVLSGRLRTAHGEREAIKCVRNQKMKNEPLVYREKKAAPLVGLQATRSAPFDATGTRFIRLCSVCSSHYNRPVTFVVL